MASACSTSIGQVECHCQTFKLFATLEVIVHVLDGVNWIESQEDWLFTDQIQYAGGQVSTTSMKFIHLIFSLFYHSIHTIVRP